MKKRLKPILKLIGKSRGLLLTLAVIGLIAYTAHQLSQLVTARPDPAYIEAEKTKIDEQRIRFDPKTVEAVRNLRVVSGQTDLSNLGKADPFSP